MSTLGFGMGIEKRERRAIATAACGASLKPHERALAAFFLVIVAVLVRACWHYAFG